MKTGAILHYRQKTTTDNENIFDITIKASIENIDANELVIYVLGPLMKSLEFTPKEIGMALKEYAYELFQEDA